MKNKKTCIMMVIVLLLGMTFIGCPDLNNGNGNGNDVFAGTWLGTESQSGFSIRIVAQNGTWTEWVNELETVRGTYTVSGNTVTLIFVEVNPNIFGGPDQWVLYAALDNEYKVQMGGSETIQMTISNNTISVLGANLTKQQGNDIFAGTWLGTETQYGNSVKLVAQNGSWTEWIIDIEGLKGTYTVSGNTVILTIVEVNPSIFGGADEWILFAQLEVEHKELIGGSETIQMTISNNTISVLGATLIKQP